MSAPNPLGLPKADFGQSCSHGFSLRHCVEGGLGFGGRDAPDWQGHTQERTVALPSWPRKHQRK